MTKFKEHKDAIIRFKTKQEINGCEAWVTIDGYEVMRMHTNTRDTKLSLELLSEAFSCRLRDLLVPRL